MAILSLNLNTRSPILPPLPMGRVPTHVILTGKPLLKRRLPIRGLIYSLILHEIAIGAMIFIPPILGPRHPDWPDKEWETTMIPKGVLYLPQLGGGHEGASPKKAAARASAGPKGPAPVKSRRGPTFAGNQEIVSNPPNPTNHIQTILQPDLPHPPTLKGLVPLPNMVLLAKAPPPPPPPKPMVRQKPAPPAVKPPPPVRKEAFVPHVPKVTLSGPQPVEAPNLTLPAPQPPATAALTPVPAAPPAPAPPEKTAERPPAPQRPQALPGDESRSARNLLALSPMASLQNASPRIPKGESRGQFAISRHPAENNSAPGMGAGASNSSTAANGVGSAEATGAGNGTGTGGGGTGGSAAGGGGMEIIGGVGGGNGGGGGSGSGSGSGSGIGHGAGSGVGSGSGAGSGPGAGPFAGMTIQGAEGPAGAVTIPGSTKAPSHQDEGGSYGMTVVSTGNSGGGVGDFGVFQNEAVFTVYLNPAETADDPMPPWALQYALLQPTGGQMQDLLPPMAVRKRVPLWAPDLIERYKGQEIVLSGVISDTGRMGQFKILQSPNGQLDEALRLALGQWVFRPATLNGNPVAVKVVLGVPVSGPQ